MSKIGVGIGTAVVLSSAFIFASPYITVHQMKWAAKKRDGEALSEHIDFVALRQNLKEQLNVVIGKEMAKEIDKGNQYAALGGLFAGMLVEKMVDNYVTPTAITQLMKGDEPEPGMVSRESTAQEQSEPFENASMSYEGFSKFSVITKNEKEEEVRFILRRRGIGWQLTEIILPI